MHSTVPKTRSTAPLHTPVALFIFNRPHNTQRVLEAIATARPVRLLVVADGARADRPGESSLCQQTRAVIDQVDWPCEVLTHYSDVNLGCKRRIASGIDWVFSCVDAAIFLEDDCLPVTSFFPFCEEMLERYRNDDRVHMVRGTNLLNGQRFNSESYYFSRFYNLWGWASRARAFKGYDVEMRQWPALRDSGWLERQLPTEAMVKLVRFFLDETHAGRVDTWDYQWMLNGWIRNALAIVPENNLVTNIGHGPGATHTRGDDSHLARLKVSPIAFPLRHPAVVQPLLEADQHEWTTVYPAAAQKKGFWRRLRERLFSLLREFQKLWSSAKNFS
jgi:hypothetical protein